MITRLVKTLLLFVFTISATIVCADCEEIDLCHPLTLSEVVDIALEHNPSTSQAWWRAKRAAASLGSAKSAYYPKLDFTSSATHGKEFEFINGPNKEFSRVQADLNLSMLLYDFGQTAASVRSAKMALAAACWYSDWTLQQVMIRAIEEAYSTLQAQANLAAALTTLEDAEKMLYTASELNRVGLRAITDVYTSRATCAQIQIEVAQKRAQLDIQRGKLATRMGLEADCCIQLACLDSVPPPEADCISDLIECANQRRSDLMAKHARLLESKAIVDRNNAAFRPKLSFAGRGGAKHYFTNSNPAGHYEVSVRFDVPIFDGFDRCFKLRQSLADMRVSSLELADLELDIAMDVLTHSRSLKAAQEMMVFAKINLDNALLAYEGVLNKYQAGHISIAEVSNALRQLALARLRESEIKTRYYVSMANLAYATGTLPPYVMVPCDK